MSENYATRLKVGVVTPSTNTTLEPDCHDLRVNGVTVHTARIAIQNRTISGDKAYDDHVKAMRAGIDDAIARVMTCAPDHLVMGVALEAFWGGLAGSQQLHSDLEKTAGVSVTMGSTAMQAALISLGVKRISVLTPHMPAGDEQVRAWFEEAGFELVNFVGLKCESPRKIAYVTVDEMRDAMSQLDDDRAHAIVQVGTNLQFMRYAEQFEKALQKPVLALNGVMVWDALRRNGIDDAIDGIGQLGNQQQ